MIFRPLFSFDTNTLTYILACEKTKEAVIIDAVDTEHERDVELLEQLGLKLKYALETHAHADHVTGGYLMCKKYPACKQVYSHHAGVTFTDNLVLVKENDEIHFGEMTLEVIETPGHTSGCISFVTKNKDKVFTGDAVFVRGCGRTDFQQGSSSTLFDSIQKVYSLPDTCSMYPGHDYKGFICSTIGEEKQYNKRMNALVNKQQFIDTMNSVKLAHPRYIDVALPRNLKGGRE